MSSRIAILILLSAFLFSKNSNAQSQKKLSDDVTNQAILDWLNDLYESGVSMTEDSVYINAESTRLLNDPSYREIMYPNIYTWEAAMGFIQTQELKKAFWYFINLYMINNQNKNLVVKSVLTYDKLFKMDKILVSTFYTYCYTDPEIGEIINGTPEIMAPHVLEAKLEAVKEILFYVERYKAANPNK